MEIPGFKKSFLWLWILVLLTGMLCVGGCKEAKSDSNSPLLGAVMLGETPLTIFTTNDRHSRLLGAPYDIYNPTTTGDGTAGGVSRLAAMFENARTLNPDTLVFDAGDFLDGTVFIAAEDGAGDLNMLATLGYDAACLGNHEMGMGPEGLAQMITNAEKDASGNMTPLLCANINFSEADTALGHADDALKALYGSEGEVGKHIFPYIIRTTSSGVRVGIFGLMGANVFMPDAAPCTFTINPTSVQALVDSLRNDEDKKVDVVICLMHAGFSVNSGTPGGEITDLAKNVSGIDVICAGHSHIKADAQVPCEVAGSDWETTIVEAGDETENLGRVDMSLNHGRVTVDPVAGELDINDVIIGMPAINTEVESFITNIEDNYLTEFDQLKDGGLFDVLAHSSVTFGRLNSMNMVSDAMRAAAGSDVAVCTPGADTASVQVNNAGDITVYDAFASMPHSMGRDGLHGGPLYKFNLFAAELQGVLELGTCNMGLSSEDLFVLSSGVKIIYNTADLRAGTGPGYIIKMYLVSADELTQTLVFDRSDPTNFPYGGWKLSPGSTYGPGDPYQPLSVCSTMLTLIGLKEVGATYDLWPRDATLTQVEWSYISELDSLVVKDGGKEVKAWYGVAEYISSFASSLVPARYDDTYTDGSSHNPIGPAWRRVWDVAVYGAP
jgi:2',3'-cyclic-nucleotide 2'-phosphodiesterase (5'-nucleotidase family)